jgi:Restriction endonuclease
MAALNFAEIATAKSGPNRDQFELFAREFLVAEGFRVVEEPDRGADGGRDMIVEEDRLGPGGTNVVRWLVSCKHNAHSGASVSPADEQNIRDRLGTHRCNGFIAFYSTLPSSGLGQTLNALKPNFEYLQLDVEAIERKLLDSPRGRVLAARYTPRTFNRWIKASQAAAITTQMKDPQNNKNQFFLRPPHDSLETAMAEATERGVLVFVVIYDPEHPTNSKLEHSLGYFLEYQTTKRLVDQHFVAIVGASDEPALQALVPEDDPLECCLWVVMTASGAILKREGVYANPEEGLKRVRAVI